MPFEVRCSFNRGTLIRTGSSGCGAYAARSCTKRLLSKLRPGHRSAARALSAEQSTTIASAYPPSHSPRASRTPSRAFAEAQILLKLFILSGALAPDATGTTRSRRHQSKRDHFFRLGGGHQVHYEFYHTRWNSPNPHYGPDVLPKTLLDPILAGNTVLIEEHAER